MQRRSSLVVHVLVGSMAWCAACGDDPAASPSPAGAAGASSARAGSPAGSAAPAPAGMGATPSTTAGAGGTAGTRPPQIGAAGASAAPAGASGAPATMDGGTPDAGVGAMDAAVDATAPPAAGCDRACLIGFMQGYVDALIARDPSKLKVSATLKYTENGVASELGETVWQTAMELVPDTRLDFADPQEGQVASHLVFNEMGGSPVIYQVRLKVESGEITEIETMAVRRQGAANGFFNVENMKPEPIFLQPIDAAQRMTREELEAVTHLYLDYLEGSKRGNDVPFDEGCKRYENGQVTASGLSSFNTQSWRFDVTRRILVIDEEAGITWGNFPFSQSERALVVGEAFKIIGGKIAMIQAVMAYQPTSAWE